MTPRPTPSTSPMRPPGRHWLHRLVRRFIRAQEDWHGEWRIYILRRYTSLCWMDPREWKHGWWFSIRKTRYEHGQTLYGIRLLGFDYSWSRYAPETEWVECEKCGWPHAPGACSPNGRDERQPPGE